MALVSDDIIFTMRMLGEDEVLTGEAEVRGLFEELTANDFQLRIKPVQVVGDTATTRTLSWGGGMPPGVAPMVAEETYVVQDGEIKVVTWVASEESNAKGWRPWPPWKVRRCRRPASKPFRPLHGSWCWVGWLFLAA